MCLILVAINERSDYPLVLAANRDEYFARPARAAGYWHDAPSILAGRDLEAGGTWLGVDRTGRLATVTNVREPPLKKTGLESRGRLVSDFLMNPVDPVTYLADVIRRRDRFDAYNLLLGHGTELYFHASRNDNYLRLENGIHGISNGDLNCDWPKVNQGKQAFHECLDAPGPLQVHSLFDILADTRAAADEELPDTGVGQELERRLSPVFVHMDGYGTRSSTVIFLDAHGNLAFQERNFNENGECIDTARFEFTVEWG